MFRDQLRSGIAHVGQALRDPEVFAVRWNQGDADYRWWVWLSLAATAILGTTTYGMTMGLLGKPGLIFYKGGVCTLAAGLAWSLPLPALYILNSLSGSRLSASSTLLAALVTTSWGGLAMIASIPINWFFSVRELVTMIHLAKFTGAPASRTEDLISQIAAAVEGLSEVSHWPDEPTELQTASVERSLEAEEGPGSGISEFRIGRA
jgi:hypothetical protein